MKHPLRAAIAWFLLVAIVVLDASPALATDRVLLIGNSLTAGIRKRFRAIARSAEHRAAMSVDGPDGMTLAEHAQSRTTLNKIRAGGWSFVVMQEQSLGIYDSRYPAARDLDAEAALAGARTIFLMTWRDRGSDLAAYDSLRGVPGGDTGYVPIAYELGSQVAPVGWVMREILAQDPAADFWGADGHHGGERAKYLAGLVLFATIYGESPVGLWPSPWLDPDVVLADQLAVERVVLGDRASWDFTPAP